MKNTDNIEKIFKDKFDQFESDVNPQVWSNVQSGINPASGGASSVATKLTIGKIIAGVAATTILTLGIWYLSSSKNETKSSSSENHVQPQVEASENGKDVAVVSEDAQVSTSAVENGRPRSQMPPAIRSLNQYGSDYTAQDRSADEEKNETANSTPENNSISANNTEQSKYGQGSIGMGNITRGVQEQKVNLKSSKKKNNEDSQEYEQVPAVDIVASAESGDAPLTVNFTNTGVYSALSWDFGDGTTTREISPSHEYKKPGTYTVKLVAQNSRGSNTDKIIIEVKSISDIETIANVFTPNGDGINDLFSFNIKNIATIEVVISDINARVVGSWNTLEGNWNGKLRNGENAPEGLYFYTIQALGTDGVSHVKKGSVTLSLKR